MGFINKLLENNGICSILLYGEINDTIAQEIIEDINTAKQIKNPIELHINSRGGDVHSGIAIINALQNCKDLKIFVDGIAASMAGVIALCGFPVFMGELSQIMIHNVKGGCYGSKDEILQCVEEMKTVENSLIQIIAKRMKKSNDEIRTLFFDGSDHWLSAEQCKQYGLINGIVSTLDKQGETLPKETNALYNCLNERNGRYSLMTFKNRLNSVLTLDNASENEIINAVVKLQKKVVSDNAVLCVEGAINRGWINETDKDVYLHLYRTNKRAFVDKMQQYKSEDSARVLSLIHDAIQNGKILPVEIETYKNIGMELGAFSLCSILEYKPQIKRINRYLELDNENRVNWTLDDWRNYDPKGLAENPLLHKLLQNKENKTPVVRGLDWYRKNDPQYLQEHPQFYKELLERETNK